MKCEPDSGMRSVRDGIKFLSERTNETEQIAGILRAELRLDTFPRDHVFDVGCGYGRFAAAIAPYVTRFTLLDPDRELLDGARQRIETLRKPSQAFCCRIEEAISMELGPFDLILMVHVLYYTPGWQRVVDCCAKLLSWTGQLAIVLWSERSDLFRYSPRCGNGEVTSELILNHLSRGRNKFKRIPLEVQVIPRNREDLDLLARFLGHTDSSVVPGLAEQVRLTDRQDVIIVNGHGD